MTIFSLSHKLNRVEDQTIIRKVMESWQGWQVQESTWILKRNDGCTCQTIMEDLLEHIDAGHQISVVEIKQEKNIFF